jgi:putative ABC transport system permease protein
LRWWQLKKRDADLERELRSDLELEEEEQRERGLSAEEASYAARRAFGNSSLIKEQTHEAWGWAAFERLLQDLRYAFRQMRRSPGFAVVVVLVLALAIGANASIFSVLDAVLLRPLEFPNANRLVQITSVKNGKPVGMSGPDLRDFATQSHTFEKMAIYDQWRKNVSTSPRSADAAEVLVGLAPAEFFEALGIQPLLGRLFTADEGLEGRNHVALITETFWKTDYQRDPKDPIGRRIELGAPASLIAQDVWMGSQRETVTIAGVMRDNRDQGLGLPVAPQLISLFRQTPVVNFGFKDVLVRSSVRPEALEQAVAQQVHVLDPQLPLSEVETMSEYLGDLTAAKRFTSVILASFAVIGLVLAVMGIYGVIAYLVAQRTQEIGIRLALGAPRSAVLWLVSSQGLGMALAGVAIGMMGTLMAARSLASLLYGISALDPVTLGSASVALIAIALAACALPARRAARIDPMRALRSE